MNQAVRTATRRRRRRRLRPQFIFTVCLMAALLIGLIALCVHLVKGPEGPVQPPEPVTEATTTRPTETEPTEPEPTTPEDRIAAFAAEHGLTLEDYPPEIIEMLKRNPETEEYVLNYPLEYGKEQSIDISGYADEEGVPLFIQWDRQWGYRKYLESVAGLSACGPTTLSMVVYHFTRDPDMHPAYMMEFAQKNKYAIPGYGGTQWALFGEGAAKFGLKVKELTAEQIASEEKLAQLLESGKLIVTSVGPGVFTTVGHYLVLVGYEDGKFQVNDPNSYLNSEKLWDFEEFAGDIRMMWAIGQ